MTDRLGYKKNSSEGDDSGDSRNGRKEKTVLLENQGTTIEALRDRNGAFEPVIVQNRWKRLPLFNDQIIPMYARGMSGCKVQEHLERIYNVEAPPDLISRVTNAALEEVKEWQNRRLINHMR
jgi:putative transposase